MVDLSKLSRPALKAAMKGGTEDWGQHGSAAAHVRYSEPLPSSSRRRCFCGCERRQTHRGMANGVCLTSACKLGIARWVRAGKVRAAKTGKGA
jgi:hypothetical protein